MELVTRGEIPSEQIYDGKCIHCGSIYTAKFGELTTKVWRNEEEVYPERCIVCDIGKTVYFTKQSKFTNQSDLFYNK